MVATNHQTYVYIGLGGEGDYIGEGGLVRRADGEEERRAPTATGATCQPSPAWRMGCGWWLRVATYSSRTVAAARPVPHDTFDA